MVWVEPRLKAWRIWLGVVPPCWAVRVFHLGPGWSGSRVVVGREGSGIVVVVVVVGGGGVGRRVGSAGGRIGPAGLSSGSAGAGVMVMWTVARWVSPPVDV